jgi:hypothetical protein
MFPMASFNSAAMCLVLFSFVSLPKELAEWRLSCCLATASVG